MPKPIDATLKALLEESPASWPRLFGLPAGAAVVVDADTSTVSGGADKVLRVSGPPDWIMHVEFQSGPDASLPRRLLLDNALLADRHDMEVQSALVLLAPKANLRNLNGFHERQFAGAAYLTFRYHVLRVWEMPLATLLEGGPSLLPLAPISDVRGDQLPAVIERIGERLNALPAPESAKLWTATYVLLGLRYSGQIASQLLEGVIAMEESVTYQAIVEKGMKKGIAQGIEKGIAQGIEKGIAQGIEKGAVNEARKAVLLVAKKRLGAAPAAVVSALDAITDLKRLEAIVAQVPEVGSWEEVISLCTARSRRRKRS